MELTPEQQTSLLEPLGFKDKARPGEEDGVRFFRLMREFTVTGFYTSEIGFKELDNPALKFYAESPECPHKGDPEASCDTCPQAEFLKQIGDPKQKSWPSKSTT